MKKHLLVLIGLSVSFAAHAEKEKYVVKGPCGSAKVVSGTTCSDVKVQMNFEGCATKSAPQHASRIICTGETVKARFSDGKYRYEASFTKKDDGWGSVEWVPGAPMAEWEPAAAKPKKVAKVEAPAPVAPTAPAYVPETPARNVAEVTTTSSSAAGTFKFSGYADLRYTANTYKDDNAPAAFNGTNESGWGVEDGALYLSYEKDKVAFLLDVPFRRTQMADDIGTIGGSDKGSKNSQILFGADKAQVLGRYKATDSLTFNIGQFDTIFGVELNDSKDRVFGKTGLVYDVLLPVTHTGLMIEYANNGFTGKVFSANPNNQGSFRDRNTTTANGGSGIDDKPEHGIALGWANDMIHAQVGYMTRSVLALDGDYKARSLTDVIIGGTWGAFAADIEYGIVDDPQKNVLDTTNATDKEKNGTGAMILASYKATDAFLVGLRYEMLDDSPGADANAKKANSYGLALHYKLSDQLELRGEYTGYKFEKVSGDKWDAARANVATLFYF